MLSKQSDSRHVISDIGKLCFNRFDFFHEFFYVYFVLNTGFIGYIVYGSISFHSTMYIARSIITNNHIINAASKFSVRFQYQLPYKITDRLLCNA